jgi:hypothetical protein
MTITSETTSTRIIPRSANNQYAYAFGYIRGKLDSLFYTANSAYYSSPEDRIAKLEEEIGRIETVMKKLESEMYPNDSE